MVDEVIPAADATAKPADVKAETVVAPAAAAAEATTKETPAAEVPNKAADKAEPDPSAKPEDKPVVPEKYDLKLSKDSLMDASEVAKIEADAKAKGLSNEQAQERLSEREDAKKSLLAQQQETQQEQIKQLHRTWAEQLEADKEFGGPKLKETAEHAKRFLDRYGDDDLRKALNDKVMRWGDNPVLLRAFARAGRSMADDKLVTEGKAGAASGNKKSIAQNLYGATHNKE